MHGLAVRCQAGREDPPIPRAHHDAAAIAGKFVGEILGIADTQDLGRRIMPKTPGGKRDRGQQGFEVSRRQIDDWAYPIVLIAIIFHPMRRRRSIAALEGSWVE